MFEKTELNRLNENFARTIGERWLLVSAGDETRCNMMTASWGLMGVLWGKPVAEIFIRPSRYTLSFLEEHETFSLCVFPEELKKRVHGICGSASGRQVDKLSETGLTPIYENGTVYFEEAETVFLCRKLYTDTLDPAKLLDQSLAEKWYDGDCHRLFLAEITAVLQKK